MFIGKMYGGGGGDVRVTHLCSLKRMVFVSIDRSGKIGKKV